MVNRIIILEPNRGEKGAEEKARGVRAGMVKVTAYATPRRRMSLEPNLCGAVEEDDEGASLRHGWGADRTNGVRMQG